MSIHSNNPKQPKPELKSKGPFKRQTHNLSENINNSSFTIQQYNNFINIDAYKNNVHINNAHNNDTLEGPSVIENNHLLQPPKSKNIPLKTSPSPMKKEIKTKKTNYSTDRYIIDRPPNAQNLSNLRNNNKKDYSNLFKKLKSKISSNALDKQMGRSFENVKTTMNSQSSKENLNNKISQLSKKFAKKASDKNFANSFAHNNNQRNFEGTDVLHNIKKIDTLLEAFLSKNEPNLQSENEVLTIYITNLLQFMLEIGEIDENFKNLFKNLRYAIEMPISKMVEQFLRLRDFLLEQNEKLQENEKEIEYLKGQLAVLLKENEKMGKNQIMLNNFFSDRYEINEFGLNSLQEIIKENNKLKNMLKKQKDSIIETREKDAKIMKLLYAIRKKGIDIEEIYNEDVKTPEEISFMDENMNNNQNQGGYNFNDNKFNDNNFNENNFNVNNFNDNSNNKNNNKNSNKNSNNKNNNKYNNVKNGNNINMKKHKYEEDDVEVSMTEETNKEHDSGIRNDLYCENSSKNMS